MASDWSFEKIGDTIADTFSNPSFNKNTVLVFGGVGVVVFWLVTRNNQTEEELPNDELHVQMPVDDETVLQEQFLNYADMIDESITTGFNSMYSEFNDRITFLEGNGTSDHVDGIDEEPSENYRAGWYLGYGVVDTEEEKQVAQERWDLAEVDNSYRNEEIDRARSVIENREEKGMDTSAQEKYLNNLINLG